LPNPEARELALLLVRKAEGDESILDRLLDDSDVPDDMLGFNSSDDRLSGSLTGSCPTRIASFLWSEQRRGYDRDPVWPSVGRRSSCDDDGVCEVIAEFIAEPAEMAQVLLVGCLPELHLDCEDLGSAFDDEVDLAVAAPGSQMGGPSLGSLCVDTDVECYQRLKQRSKQRSLASHRRAGRLCVQQRGCVDAQ
jgi:hypothetical protein